MPFLTLKQHIGTVVLINGEIGIIQEWKFSAKNHMGVNL